MNTAALGLRGLEDGMVECDCWSGVLEEVVEKFGEDQRRKRS